MVSFLEQEFYHEDIVKTELLLTSPPASGKYSPPHIIKAISQEQVKFSSSKEQTFPVNNI